MTTKPIGLYLHIPFCVRKCNYCDFCSFATGDCDWREEYINSLCREIECYKGRDITLDSIFFGGGTPSLLNVDEFKRITDTINDCFTVDADTEFTIEANPKTLTEEKLSSYISCGVNRLSIGLQSIHDNEQKILGRIHNFDDFLRTYNMAIDLGINNINIDLMYGIPEQTMESFSKTLDAVTALSPQHISLYGLIIEEGTPFYNNRHDLELPSEDSECDMYYLAAKMLREKGYGHYEISNYVREGFSCQHNLKYWHAEEYIGVGLAAHSYFNGRRFANTENINDYLSGNFANYAKGEIIDDETRAYEYVMLSLRLAEGFSLSDYNERFGVDFRLGREDTLKMLMDNDLLIINGDRLSLTEKGMYVSNNILSDLI